MRNAELGTSSDFGFRTATASLPTSGEAEFSDRRPLAVDLFAGAGGLGLGFEQAGFEIVAAVEYDPVHAATHLFNFPNCEVLCRDISKLSGEQVVAAARAGFNRTHPGERFPERLDAVIGGPPCQGFSTGGKRIEGDERNNLLLEYVRLVVEIRPLRFCLENVAGLLESKFDTVRLLAFARLEEAGYTLSGTESPLNSLHFGVPQTRRRVIVLGSLDGIDLDRPEQTSDVRSVEDAFEGLPAISDYEELLVKDEVRLNGLDLLKSQSVIGDYAKLLTGFERTESDFSQLRAWDKSVLTNSKRTIHQISTVTRFAATEPGFVEPVSRLYRLPLKGPSRTLRAGTGAERGAHTSPRPIHPVEDRVITVREAARLHGYPDWFRFHATNWHGHRQVGNSVPPPLALAAARVLVRSLGLSPAPTRKEISLGEPGLLRMSQTGAREVVQTEAAELPATRTRPETARPSSEVSPQQGTMKSPDLKSARSETQDARLGRG